MLWEEWFGEDAEAISFDKMMIEFYRMLGSKELPADKLPVKMQTFINAYLIEEDRFRKQEEPA